jgi:hypothetical protein
MRRRIDPDIEKSLLIIGPLCGGYWISRSARSKIPRGILMPICFAAAWLMARKNLSGVSTKISPGLDPFILLTRLAA